MASNSYRCRTHKYRLNPITKLWSCINCTHHMPKHYEASMASVQSICNECDLPFKMSHEALQEDAPRCASCRGVNEIYTGIAEVLAKLEKTGTE